MRVFVAVDISAEVRREVSRRIDFLRSKFSNLRVGWDKPEKLHLTLKFLGGIDEQQLQDLIIATEKAVQGISPFELTIAGANVFPFKGRARVLWLDIAKGKETLKKLNERLEDECLAVGFERGEHEYTPHLTIARLREPHNSAELAKLHVTTHFPAISFQVNEIIIMKSDLSPQGSNYTSLKSIEFKQ